MLQFRAVHVGVYAGDDAITEVLFQGQDAAGGQRSLELQLRIRMKGDSPYPYTRVALTNPRAAGTDCVARAVLRRKSFRIDFQDAGKLGQVGAVRVAFDLDAKRYRQLVDGLVEVFAGAEVFRIVAA